jgi:hypothetical protein
MIGFFCYHYDSRVAEFIMYDLVPFWIYLDKAYIAFQSYHAFKVQQALDLAPSLALIAPHIEAQRMYAELLPIVGYDFLSQFDELDLELLKFYLQAIDTNIYLSFNSFLINDSLSSQCSLAFLL